MVIPIARSLVSMHRRIYLIDVYENICRLTKITGANAGGPRRLQIQARWAARIAQFRW